MNTLYTGIRYANVLSGTPRGILALLRKQWHHKFCRAYAVSSIQERGDHISVVQGSSRGMYFD